MTPVEGFVSASVPFDLAADAWVVGRAPGGGAIRYPRPTAALAIEAATRIRESKDALSQRPVAAIVTSLARATARFLDPTDPLRQRAEAALPEICGFSVEMSRVVIDGMAAGWTEPRLLELLRADFPDPEVLDRFRPQAPQAPRTLLRAISGSLALHLGAGNVPGVGATSLIRSLLVKAPLVLKPGAGDVVLSVLLREAIVAEDPVLGRSVGVLYWPGGEGDCESVLLEMADPVVIYGGLETVRRVRSSVPPQHAVVAYHHRLGVGVVGRAALSSSARAQRAADDVAGAVAVFDQRGCVSPQVLFVEEGSAVSPTDWVDFLARSFDAVEASLPPGTVDPEQASTIHQLRGVAEAEAIAGGAVILRTGGRGLGWTVICDPNRDPGESWGNRTVLVIPISDATEIPNRLNALSSVLQTVGFTGLSDRAEALAELLANVGALRLVPFVDAPWPPASWRHDGRDPLRALVRWVEWMPEDHPPH